jgi:hypothetical protein
MTSQQISIVGTGSNRQTNWTCKRLKGFLEPKRDF